MLTSTRGTLFGSKSIKSWSSGSKTIPSVAFIMLVCSVVVLVVAGIATVVADVTVCVAAGADVAVDCCIGFDSIGFGAVVVDKDVGGVVIDDVGVAVCRVVTAVAVAVVFSGSVTAVLAIIAVAVDVLISSDVLCTVFLVIDSIVEVVG